jgi:hypothetical protein
MFNLIHTDLLRQGYLSDTNNISRYEAYRSLYIESSHSDNQSF